MEELTLYVIELKNKIENLKKQEEGIMKQNVLKFTAFLLILAGVFSSCKEKEGQCGEIKKPKDLKPIDWENYNDVYTVYWNYFGYCDDREFDTGDTVSVYGWKSNFYDLFYISAVPEDNKHPVIGIKVSPAQIAAADLTKKCFVRGLVILPCLDDMGCSVVSVQILATNIYFEEE